MPDRAEAVHPHLEATLESQDFGWVTGMEKQAEVDAAAQAFGVDAKTAKRLIKHPFYSYPGGHSFFDLYVDVIDGLHRLGHATPARYCASTRTARLCAPYASISIRGPSVRPFPNLENIRKARTTSCCSPWRTASSPATQPPSA